MSEGPTKREALLEARVKELEAAAQASVVSVAQGGVFEAIWRTVVKFVPPWLAAAAVAVLLAHYGFEYYMAVQIKAAETQLKQAKRDVETAKADALNGKVGDEPMRLATVRAELEKTQAEAAQAEAEATALTAEEHGETMRLATLKAQLAAVQNQAALLRAKADAASAKFGEGTLQQRLVRANLIQQKFAVIDARVKTAVTNVSRDNPGNIQGMYAVMLRAECEDNQFADAIGCPAQYVREARQLQSTESDPTTSDARARQPRSAGPVTGTTDVDKQGFDALVDKDAPVPSPHRKPAKFDCSQASMGSDFVICSSNQLLDAEARLEDAYQAARTAGGDNVRKDQIAWMKSYGPNCGLPLRGRPASRLIGGAQDCIFAAIMKRVSELQASH